jgi:uncharacterized membrane protein YkvA (DUF1232 family)
MRNFIDMGPVSMKAPTRVLANLRAKATRLKRELYTLYLASRDHRMPWYAKMFVICIVAYALSPIDLIPDPIPVLGYVDDLLLLPLGIYLALKMIPNEILMECREKAQTMTTQMPRSRMAAAVILFFWIVLFVLLGVYLLKFFRE